MAVNFPERAEPRDEPLPVTQGQVLPQSHRMRSQPVDDGTPVASALQQALCFDVDGMRQLRQGDGLLDERRDERSGIPAHDGTAFVRVRHQTASGEKRDWPRPRRFGQAEDRVDRGEATAKDTDAFVRFDNVQTIRTPRIGDEPLACTLPDAAERVVRQAVANRQHNGAGTQRCSPPQVDHPAPSRMTHDPADFVEPDVEPAGCVSGFPLHDLT
ncbi:hypothetical protein SYNGFB01_03540 [Synechococcus sp. GFB01]|nr:hypothetical protein SYNGFB01_03540 [Synechococcus sp. GFB01]